MDLDYGLLTLLTTIALPVVAFLARKRIGRYLFRTLIEFARDDYFEEVSQTTGDGSKRVLLRPNAKGGAFLSSVLPGLVDWASANVKIKLPSFALPEGLDLKQVGVNVLAQKALSGKKLRLDDAIPLLIGYAKDYLGPILEGLGGSKPKPSKEAVNPFLKEFGS